MLFKPYTLFKPCWALWGRFSINFWGPGWNYGAADAVKAFKIPFTKPHNVGFSCLCRHKGCKLFSQNPTDIGLAAHGHATPSGLR